MRRLAGRETGRDSMETAAHIATLTSFNAVSVNVSDSLAAQSGGLGAGGASRVFSPAASYGIEEANDGLLSAYGNGGSPVVLAAPSVRRGPSAAIHDAGEMVRRPNPYESIPSFYDMYVQAVARPAAPGRFGAEVFENGTQGSQSIPMDLPVGPEYVVGPGDALSVDLWGGVSQRLYRTVDREGRVSLPEVGPILVSGKSLAAVQQNLQQILRTQFRDVSADVSLARLRTIRVYEVGDA